MAKTAPPIPSKVILFGDTEAVVRGISFTIETQPDNAALILAGRDGHLPLVSFPLTLDDFRNLGVRCLTCYATRMTAASFASFPAQVELNSERLPCTGFTLEVSGDGFILGVFRPRSQSGGRVEPLVQIPLTLQQVHDLGIAAIVFAETR
jgi:hypothetical protein